MCTYGEFVLRAMEGALDKELRGDSKSVQFFFVFALIAKNVVFRVQSTYGAMEKRPLVIAQSIFTS